MRKVDQLKNGSDIYGNRVKCKIVKNKVAPPFKVAEFDILYGKGISHAGEVLDFGVALDIIKKSGAWFSYDGERIGQGKDNVRALLEGDPALMAEIEEKIREQSAQAGMPIEEYELDEDDEEGDEFDIRTMKEDGE